MRRFVAIAVLLFSWKTGLAQRMEGANWLFGTGAGVSFVSGVPLADTLHKQQSSLGCGSVSDAHGNLLFYTNGRTVWNRNNQAMPNGTGLLSADTGKAVLIQKKPGSNALYYIFVATNPVPGNYNTGQLFYTVVDMDQQEGLGDVLPMMKNIQIGPRVARMVAAAQHANGRDFWIIAHGWGIGIELGGGIQIGRWDTACYAFSLTQQGLDPTPVKSIPLGGEHVVMDALSYRKGWMRTSPNSEKVAWAVEASYSYMVILNFNRANGSFSYFFSLASDGFGKGCFSADSRYFFNADAGGRILSYDLTYPTPDEIRWNAKVSLVEYYGLPSLDYRKRVTDVQLGIDGKLYVNPYQGATFLSRINNPCKRYGPDIGWEPYAVDLKGRRCGLDFPVHNQTLFVNAGTLQAQAAKDTICAGDSVLLSAYGAGTEVFAWTKGSETAVFATRASVKVAPQQTTHYRVRGQGTCGAGDTTLRVVVVPRPVAQATVSGQACSGKLLNLSAQTGAGWRYRWASNCGTVGSPRTAATGLQTTGSDTAVACQATLWVTNAGCTVAHTVPITLFPVTRQKPTLSPWPDTAFCAGQQATLTAASPPGFATVWSTGTTGPALTVHSSGSYTARLVSGPGCLSDSFSTVTVTVHPLPAARTLANGKKDTVVCFPASLSLGIGPEPSVAYQWQGGWLDSLSSPATSNPVFTFSNSDTAVVVINYGLWVMDGNTGCSNRDSLRIAVVPNLRPYAGPDFDFCNENQPFIGTKGVSAFGYQWSPAAGLLSPQTAQSQVVLQNPSFENILKTSYIRTVRMAGCQAADTVLLTLYPQVPRPVLGGPQFVCPGVQQVPYQLSTSPAVSNFEFLTLNFEPSGGTTAGNLTVDWGAENNNAGIRLKLGNVFGCQADSTFLPVSITRTLRPQTVLTPGLNDSLCLASAQNIHYHILPFNPKSQYRWHIQPEALLADSTHNPSSITYNHPGLYQLTLTEADTTPLAQCFGTTGFNLRIWPQPVAKSILGEDSVCQFSSKKFEVEGQKVECQYHWTATKGDLENQAPNGGTVQYVADFEMNGNFESIELKNTETSDKGCVGPENSKTVVVESLPKPIILPPAERLEWKSLTHRSYMASGRPGSWFYWEAENGTIVAGQGGNAIEISWLPDALRYQLNVQETTALGCVGESGWVVVPYDSALFVPNLITPNDDEKNDRLFIQNLHFYPQNELAIYDRWGKRIAHFNPYRNTWPEQRLQPGLYFFTLVAAQQAINGWLMVETGE